MLLISWQRGFPQRMSQKMLVLSLVRPVLALMKAVLSFLILARGSEVSNSILIVRFLFTGTGPGGGELL